MRTKLLLLCAAGLLIALARAQAATHYVDAASTNAVTPFTNWANAAAVIQDAVDAAAPGDEIVVTNGVYQTGARAVYGMSNRVAVTKPVTVRSVNGPTVTSIVGSGPNGPTAVRCVFMTNEAVLSGFTLTNGATQTDGDSEIGSVSNSGGGVWCPFRSPVVTNCVLAGNSAFGPGGAAFGNTLNNCTLTGNSATYGAGAAGTTLNNCTLTGNSAGDSGGGAVWSTLNNCTLTGNSAYADGGGAAWSMLNNCIVYYNSSDFGAPNQTGSILNYCCTTPDFGSGGVGNITNAPLFVDTNGWSNLRLQSNSPCINAGNNAYVTTTTDLDGLPRIAGGTVDIGAYEFQSPASTISYAWLQQSGLPTDGSADDADTDHDGHNNWQEWMAGTNPTNALSVLRLASPVITPTHVTLTWTSVTNRTYTLEQTTNLGGAPAFSVLRSNLAGLPGTTSWTDTNAPVSSPRFYQLRVSP